MNALGGATLAVLHDAVRTAAEPGREIRVIVIRGSGHTFCAGNDPKWLARGVLAEFGDAYMQRNLLPSGGGSQRLPRKIGLARAMYCLVTRRRMTGCDGERMGFASLAVSGGEFDAATMQLACEIARIDADALAAMKHMTCRVLEIPLNDGLTMERWMQYRN